MVERDSRAPELGRPDAGTVLFGSWRVGDRRRQDATVDAIADAWRKRPWPDSRLRSYSVFAGADGDTLLHYAELADGVLPAAQPATAPAWKGEVDESVPGIERVGVTPCRHFRSARPGAGASGPAGCYVLVTVEFEAADTQRQRDWVDGVFAASDTDPQPQPEDGLVAAHFHLSADGARVLNFAEWTSEQAYLKATSAPVAARSAARDFPGIRQLTVGRFSFRLRLVGASAG